jgi:FMN phosphatase YigB (HAD superfamily)
MDLNSENNGTTYFIDIDGTLVHNKQEEDLEQLLLTDNEQMDSTEELLPNVMELWNSFKSNDIVVVTTARSEKYRTITFNMRYDMLIMDLRTGPRVLINDTPDTLSYQKAIAINVKRDQGFNLLMF